LISDIDSTLGHSSSHNIRPRALPLVPRSLSRLLSAPSPSLAPSPVENASSSDDADDPDDVPALASAATQNVPDDIARVNESTARSIRRAAARSPSVPRSSSETPRLVFPSRSPHRANISLRRTERDDTTNVHPRAYPPLTARPIVPTVPMMIEIDSTDRSIDRPALSLSLSLSLSPHATDRSRARRRFRRYRSPARVVRLRRRRGARE
jgi:hypothetical protein